MSTPNRAEKINAIIASRKPIAEKTAEKIGQLKFIQSQMQSCMDLLTKASQKGMFGGKQSDAEGYLADMKRFLEDSLPGCVRDLAQLESRFSRPTLNIGIVGNAGQGKSTLLQKLTGLSDDEIPSGGGGDCTGAAAIIENSNNREVYADIEFYSESEFLSRIVAPYYRVLELPAPVSLDEFARSDLKNEKKDHYDEVVFLERLQTGLDKYR